MSFFTSCWLSANQPPRHAVTSPATMSRLFQAGVVWKAGEDRSMRQIPALATAGAGGWGETGGAGAMAAGSHGWSGNCADLVMAAIATRRATRPVTSGWPVHTGEPIASLTFVVPVTAM